MFLRPIASLTLLLSPALLTAQVTASAHSADLKSPNGAVIGKIAVTAAPRGVLVRIEATGLTPGWHGMHFHEKGDCSDAAFKGAGAHVHAPASKPVIHGFLDAAENDAGDLPNLFVNPDGTATVEFYSTFVRLSAGGDAPSLLDDDGSALVIHANPDDYHSQPIGGAGARIACAVIR